MLVSAFFKQLGVLHYLQLAEITQSEDDFWSVCGKVYRELADMFTRQIETVQAPRVKHITLTNPICTNVAYYEIIMIYYYSPMEKNSMSCEIKKQLAIHDSEKK